MWENKETSRLWEYESETKFSPVVWSCWRLKSSSQFNTVYFRLAQLIGIPEKVINIIHSFHDGMQTRLRMSITDEFTEPLEVSAGLKTGLRLHTSTNPICPVFHLFFSPCFQRDFGVRIRHKQDGNLFNTRRLKNKSTQIATIGERLYADDKAYVDDIATNLQTATTSLNEAYLSWRLTINKPKTEVLHANCPDHIPRARDER